MRNGRRAMATRPLPNPTRPRTKLARAKTAAAAAQSRVTGASVRSAAVRRRPASPVEPGYANGETPGAIDPGGGIGGGLDGPLRPCLRSLLGREVDQDERP